MIFNLLPHQEMIFNVRTVVAAAFLIALGLEAFSQNLLNGVLEMPAAFERGCTAEEYDAIESDPAGALFGTGRVWVVMSDRAENAIYSEADKSSTQVRNAGFGDRFRVLAIKGKFVQLTSEKGSLNPIGWIETSSLALSTAALNASPLIKSKVLILPNIDGAEQSLEMSKDKRRYEQFHSNPRLDAPSGRKAMRLRPFFVLKETKTSLLLSSAEFLTSNNSAGLQGWMARANTTDWQARLAYGENYTSEAQSEFGDRKLPIHLDAVSARLHSVQGYPNLTDASVFREIAPDFPSAEIMRMPDISANFDGDLPRNTRQVVFIAKASEVERQRLIKKFESNSRELETVNVVFVVDATHSMAPYIEQVRESLERLMRDIKQEEKLTIRFGVVAYRDKSEEEGVLQIRKLTTDVEAVIQFLKQLQCYSDQSDQDYEESVFNAFVEGLPEVGIDPYANNANLVVWIGDAGNRQDESPTRYDATSWMKNLYQKDMVVFQVHHYFEQTFQDFQLDALSMIESISDPDGQFDLANESNYSVIVRRSGNAEAFPSASKLFIPQNSDRISPEILRQDLYKSIVKFMEQTGEKVDIGRSTLAGTTEVSRVEFRKLFPSASEEELDKFILYQGDFSRKGFIDLRQGTAKEAFIPYIFLTGDEMDKLTDVFDGLPELNAGAFKDKFQQSMMELVDRFFGDSFDLTRNKMTLAEIWWELFRIKMTSPIGVIPLDEISSRFDSYTTEMEQIASEIEFFLARQRGGYFNKRNQWHTPDAMDDVYYWIELKEFPGAIMMD